MFVESVRRDYNGQILRAYVLTLLGVFTSVLLWLWLVVPLGSADVWPLLELPISSTGRKAPAVERDLFVSIRQDGDLFLNQKLISAGELTRRLAAISADPRHAPPEIFVRVDRSAAFGSVRPLLRAAQLTRRANLVFLAKPRPGSSFFQPLPPPLPPQPNAVSIATAAPGCPDVPFFKSGDHITPPRIVQRVGPELPFVFRFMHFSGSAVMEVFITASGDVCAVRIVRGIAPALDNAIITAVKQWRFSPAEQRGAHVACIFPLTVKLRV
jgi:TonB family protein